MNDSDDGPSAEDPDDGWQERAEQQTEVAEKTADLIASGADHAWVVEAIAVMIIPTLAAEIGTATLDAPRSEVREKVERARALQATLRELIVDPHVMVQVVRHWPEGVAWRRKNRYVQALWEDGPEVERALAASTKNLIVAGKRRSSIMIHAIAPEWFCAAYGVILWRLVWRDEPKIAGVPFARFSAALWQAAGGAGEPSWGHWAKAVLRDEKANDRHHKQRWLLDNKAAIMEQFAGQA